MAQGRVPDLQGRPPGEVAELVDQLAGAADLLRAAGFAVVQHEGYEADDVMASAAASARAAGWRSTVVTSDRDSFALIDETTSVLRVIVGGIDASPLLTPARLPAVCGVEAGQYRDYAAIRGDTSDNLPGALGIGAKTAAKLLAAFRRVEDAYAALAGGREQEVVAAIGPAATKRLTDPVARENVARNLHLMAMCEDLELPGIDAMRVPMDLVRLQAGLRERDIHLTTSLWALTGGAPPGGDGWGWVAEQQDLPAPSRPVGEREAAAVVVVTDEVQESEQAQLSLF